MLANGKARQRDGKCNREQTADQVVPVPTRPPEHREGKGETVR